MWQRTDCRRKQAYAACHKLKANQCSSVLTQLYRETPVLWLTVPVSTVLLKLRIRNLRADLVLVPACCRRNVPEAELDGAMYGAHTGRCSLQSSCFPWAVPASHLHLYLPTNVQTLNGVLQQSNRLEMQICWHKNCPISPNTVLSFPSS